jgi:hypothetical protein
MLFSVSHAAIGPYESARVSRLPKYHCPGTASSTVQKDKRLQGVRQDHIISFTVLHVAIVEPCHWNISQVSVAA